MEYETCDNCGSLGPLFEVSWELRGRLGIFKYKLCRYCFRKLRKLRDERKIHRLRIFEKPDLNKLGIFEDNYEG